MQKSSNMPIVYKVSTFIGDYPIDNQPYWDKEYQFPAKAITDARKQHAEMLARHKENSEKLYTIVHIKGLDPDEEDVVWLVNNGIEYRGVKKATQKADELCEELS